MYYAGFGLLSIVLHFILNHEYFRGSKDTLTSVSSMRYRYFLYSVLVYYASDVLWGSLYEIRIVPLVYTDTVIYFISMAVSVLLWTRFVVAYLSRKSVFDKIITYAGWVIVVYEIISLVINFFYPIFFAFEADGEYKPAFARYITLGMQVILFTMTAIYTLYVTSKTEGKTRLQHLTIGFSGIVMTVFIILQTLYPLLPFYAIGCLIATCLVHEFVAQVRKIDYDRELGSAKHMASTDPLTGVKNAHAYMEAKKHMEQRILNGSVSEFSVAVFDVNGLKYVNDTQGHDQGDALIKNASRYICRQFKHSPVYRVGGDEFVIILEGEDHRNRKAHMRAFEKKMDSNKLEGLPVVSSGMSDYPAEDAEEYDAVFARADHNMYERKKILKSQ